MVSMDFIGSLHFGVNINNSTNNKYQSKIKKSHRGSMPKLWTQMESLIQLMQSFS